MGGKAGLRILFAVTWRLLPVGAAMIVVSCGSVGAKALGAAEGTKGAGAPGVGPEGTNGAGAPCVGPEGTKGAGAWKGEEEGTEGEEEGGGATDCPKVELRMEDVEGEQPKRAGEAD